MFRHRGGFTVLEVMIVVVILGILAAIVVPQFGNATGEAAVGSTYHEVYRIRRAVEVYRIRHDNALPDVSEGVGTWGGLLTQGEYMKSAPVNTYVGGPNKQFVVLSTGPDAGFQTDHGWLYNPATGEVWAGGFDGDDNPHPKD